MSEETGKNTVYVDVEDDISTIIEKVEATPKEVVAVVLPKRSAVMAGLVNMRLLKQSSEAANKKVVLVTSEEAIASLAGTAGLAVAKDLQSAPEIPQEQTLVPVAGEPYSGTSAKNKTETPKLNSVATVGSLEEAHQRKEPETIDLSAEEPEEESEPGARTGLAGAAAGAAAKLPKVKVPNFDRFRNWFIYGAAALVALIVFWIFASKVLPKATIDISTTSSAVDLNMNLQTSGGAKKLDETNGIIPATTQTYKNTATAKFTPTGKQDIGSKATGSVSITNCWDTSPHTLPSGTIFTANSLNYSTVDSATVPAGSFSNGGSTCNSSPVSVDVIAAAAGTSYNQAATSYTTSSLSGNYTISGSAMTGGSSNVVTVVSQADLNAAAKTITGDASQPTSDELTSKFKDQLDQQGYFPILATLKVGKPVTSSSPGVSQQATSATATVTTTLTVIAVKKADITKAVSDYATSQIDKSKQKIDTTDIMKNVTIDVTTQSSSTDAALALSGNVNAVPLIDQSTVAAVAAGKKKGAIISEISSWPGVKSVDVHLSPFWVTKVPAKASKVTVNIQAAGN